MERVLWAAVRAVQVVLVVGVLVGCSDHVPEPAATSGSRPVAAAAPPEIARLAWDVASVRSAAPGLVGWRDVGDGRPSLVQLTEETTAAGSVRDLWRAPQGSEVEILALDAFGSQAAMLVAVRDDTVASGSRRALAVVGERGAAEVRPPSGYEVTDAAFIGDGRLIAVATALTEASVDSTLGVIAPADGAWRPLRLAGRLPKYHFVERVMSPAGTEAVALILKTPGTPADRDDEALVLAGIEGEALVAYSSAFFDDSLPGAEPLYAARGVIFARTWRVVAGRSVVDLVRAIHDGFTWQEEVVLANAGIANGIETGQVAAAGPEGALWLREGGAWPDGESRGEERLLRLEAGADAPRVLRLDVRGVDSWWWVDRR